MHCCGCPMAADMVVFGWLWLTEHYPGMQVHRKAFTYHWRMWTVPEVLQMLEEAGFATQNMHIWARPINVRH